MTRADQTKAVTALGFTDRQASFLVTAALHSGVCVGRQYCAHARIVRGQKSHEFFGKLVARKLATPYASAHRGARMYHIQGKPLYAALGEPDNRNRRPATVARAIERLMLLDAVLANHQLRWLGSEREKVDYFTQLTSLRPNELPHLGFGTPPRHCLRHFPDKLPIGVSDDGRRHLFLYLVTRTAPVDFRAFLHRHVELFRALPEWELRLLVPGHLQHAGSLFQAVAKEELARPLRLDVAGELGWFFREQREVEAAGAPSDAIRFGDAHRRFHAPRYRTLYRLWKKQGDPILLGTVSPVLGDALASGRGRITTEPVVHGYQHLSSLVGSA